MHIAAKGDNVDALLASGYEIPEGIDTTEPLDIQDPRTVQWPKDSVDYMTQAAASSSALAMINLTINYAQGDAVPKNLKTALTYEYEAQMQAYPNLTNWDKAASISRVASQLSANQVATAKADAVTLVKSASDTQ